MDCKSAHLLRDRTLPQKVTQRHPELLDKVNQVVVGAGHDLVKKKESEALRGRCDSFVVETDVHFPTDINLLFDAMRKVITLMARWSDEHDLSDWRQHAYNIRQLKRLMRAAQNKKRSKAKSEEQKKKNEALIVKAHQAYLDTASHELNKARDTLATLDQRGYTSEVDEQKQREVARNIHRIGDILWKHEKLREQRKNKYSDRSPPCKRAA